VIAVFTKFDQFKRDIMFKLKDKGLHTGTNLNDEVERIFLEHYQASLRGTPPFVRLESEYSLSTYIYCADFCSAGMHKHNQPCTDLIEMTANSLSDNVLALMLLAVQRDNLEPNIKHAIKW